MASGPKRGKAAGGKPGQDLAAVQARHLENLARIGVALSAESRPERVFEMVVDEARELTGADAGTLYIVNDEGTALDFVVLQNDTMNTFMGGTSGVEITLPPVPMYNAEGEENHANVSSHVALTGEIVNIEDVYEAEGFDFTGTRKYDEATGYRSRSMLVLPMQNHENDIIGVLQLLNATSSETGEVGAFDPHVLTFVASLASQAAVVLTNNQLIRDLKRLLYSFIQAIAAAIDAKSPYTSGHIDRVVKVSEMIAERINAQTEGPYADVQLDEDELEELRMAAWMHDVGKITTPEHVVDKATKLEAIIDRVELVKTRFALIGKAREAELMDEVMAMACEGSADLKRLNALAERVDALRDELREDMEFVAACNQPGEFMDPDKVERIRAIATKTYRMNGEEFPYLSENEVMNLCIKKGSLTDAERKIIENHAVVTGEMLAKLPFPKRLARVPEFAAGHHEKLDGSGYPKGLSAEDLPLQARILAVADIFEALTAPDRPYKKPMGLSQAVKILGFMVKDGHIDQDILDLFISTGGHMDYARQEMKPEQIDIEES